MDIKKFWRLERCRRRNLALAKAAVLLDLPALFAIVLAGVCGAHLTVPILIWIGISVACIKAKLLMGTPLLPEDEAS